MMTTFKRLGVYLLMFFILLGLLTFTDLWRSLDYFVFRVFHLESAGDIKLTNDLVLVDIPYHPQGQSSFDLPEYRRRVADLLETVANRGQEGGVPDAVVLDMYFSNDDREIPALKSAMQKLKAANTRVYAVFNTIGEVQKTFEERKQEHALELYELLEGPYLHTRFKHTMGTLSYKSEVEIPTEAGGMALVEALPLRVARDHNDKIEVPFPPREYVLPLGSRAEVESHTFRYTHEAGTTSGGEFMGPGQQAAVLPDLDDKIVLIGSLEEDRLRVLAGDRLQTLAQAGPQVVAWATDDQLNANRNARTPLNHPLLVLGQILFFAFFTVLIDAILFKYVKAWQTKPLLLAVMSLVLAAVMLVALSGALLALGYVTPVGLTLLGMVIAALLAWRFARKFLVTGVAEGSGKYDVFISYSRKHGDWVVKNLYEPLKELRKADGSPLVIFFDRDEIGVGEAFTSKYMWAIVDSRFFIPVFSEDYYGKNHCRNEMDLAYKRSVEKMLTILPVAHSDQAVPNIYAHMNYVDAMSNQHFFDGIRKALLGSAQPREADR